jgi:hypothetical protein
MKKSSISHRTEQFPGFIWCVIIPQRAEAHIKWWFTPKSSATEIYSHKAELKKRNLKKKEFSSRIIGVLFS